MVSEITQLCLYKKSNHNRQLSTCYLFGLISPGLTQERNKNRLYMSARDMVTRVNKKNFVRLSVRRWEKACSEIKTRGKDGTVGK